MVRTPIIEALKAYSAGGKARWHTPGHKGRVPLPYLLSEWDVTEVRELTPKSDGDDPIHDSERLMAQSFGVQKTWYSVQGATLPVMAAILAACPPESSVVVDRIAHRSVHAALILGHLRPIWAYSRVGPGGYPLPVNDEERVRLIEQFQPKAVIVTNPTYEGLAADLSATAAICRQHGIPLIVDEAHGTHFWGHEGFPRSALVEGADLVCHGVHKTERSLTQTGLLHLNSPIISVSQVQDAWDLLATSSPSYLLLASLDDFQFLRHQEEYHRGWHVLAEQLRALRARWRDQGLNILQDWWELQGGQADAAKLTILGDGSHLLRKLEPFGVEEKSDPFGVTLIVTPYDDLNMVKAALDAILANQDSGPHGALHWGRWPILQQIMPPYQAMTAETEWIPWSKALGRIAARPLIPYPPGIPLVVPGEGINQDVISWLTEYRDWYLRGSGDLKGLQPPPPTWDDEGTDEGLWVIKNAVP
ncbi:aminotransferase class I/II-fold pyridoxal phosphate-dependent enzyme [Sulfobacillus thermosulfidooxidans]|uniref:aminotransferase class I/II-fold pyridoxal phosphate-dependent enzyme n=1 Tax=Sulfobacillus thermosulfidooxidans TaxID=28034 RepID=UPI0004196E68|nr:aminotransferase class I/II-fold pyridoxal phosphate-dependent enzyme [Sulfobacillus thermosulfidooxidans]